MIIPRYYEDLDFLHEHTMPPRAYYIPASHRMEDLVEHREASDRVQMLNGMWKFRYFESIYDVRDAFMRAVMIRRILMRFPCLVSGRWQAMTRISTRISAIHFRLIRRMCRRIFRVVRMCIRFLMRRMRRLRRCT